MSGEIADMMLDGDMCTICGEIMEGDGYPTMCAGCKLDEEKENNE